jgi:head-tail adaptor
MAIRRAPIEPGRCRWRVTIESRPADDTTDTSGAPIDGPWTTLLDDVPMARTDVQGRERFIADQESALADTRWEMGYRADMDPDLVDVVKLRRLVVRGRVYDIEAASVMSVGGSVLAGIELMTRAKVA